MKSPALSRTALVWALALLVIPLRLLSTNEPSRHAVEQWTTLSNLSGYLSMSLFAISVVLLASSTLIDRMIGTKGQRLCLHHQLGLWVLILASVHALLLTARFLPDDLYRAFTSLLPLHRRWEVNIGIWGFYGLAATLSATIIHGAPTLWRWIHRTSIIWITLAAIHTHLTGPTWAEGFLLNLYMWTLYLVALASLVTMYVHKYGHHKHSAPAPLIADHCAQKT
jgi:predicted ferric reductase